MFHMVGILNFKRLRTFSCV